eukprot:7754950-Lingulodinium_polyedra.AAC.1
MDFTSEWSQPIRRVPGQSASRRIIWSVLVCFGVYAEPCGLGWAARVQSSDWIGFGWFGLFGLVQSGAQSVGLGRAR